MDKIRMRLVRSQSMGVGMGSSGIMGSMGNLAGTMGRPLVVASAASSAAPSSSYQPDSGRNASIVLLDERRLEMMIQPRLYAGELLDLVAAHCQLKEKEFFGLAVLDENGQYTWLQLDRRVLDHDLPKKPLTLTIHFFVKFFIESISHLTDNRTVELFYLQARSLIFRGTLEVDSDIVFQLAALSLQASHGDFVDAATTRNLLKKCPVLPAGVLKEHSSLTFCEDQVIEHYVKTKGQTRGEALVNYMTIIESMPTYGVHYFEVYDKRQNPLWLGLSCRGIAQYNHSDRKTPVQVYQWKQLENLYFRDKKFSIEVHDRPSVVQTLSSFNLYEDALKLTADAESQKDALVDAIADSTTQVSVSRRSFNPGTIHVYVWFGKNQSQTKCIWQSAISQHQFYLDRKQAKMRHMPQRLLKEIARELTRSSVSLSSTSSVSNLSRSGSTHSLAAMSVKALSAGGAAGDECVDGGLDQSEETRRAKMEMLAALKARREALESKMKEKRRLLKELCIKEGELTGELPSEIPLDPGEPLPVIRKRVGTEFALSEALLQRMQSSPEEELLAKLELEFEIQSKITSAALKISNDSTAAKSVRKQRKVSYQQCLKKLQDIELRLNNLKLLQSKQRRKLPRIDQHDGQHHQHQLQRQGSHDRVPMNANSLASGMHHGGRPPRRGLSVPDLDSSASAESPIQAVGSHGRRPIGDDNEDEEDSAAALSPRSAPSSPRKYSHVNNHHNLTQDPIVGRHQKHADSISLESSPQRMPRVVAGYIPSSVYLRSSYRSKQYPTLSSSTRVPVDHKTTTVVNTSNVKTLPGSPYRNKYEMPNLQMDSPVGLYNIPQQRTSQAFSSMDDLDAMVASQKQLSGSPSPGQNYVLNHRQLLGQAQEIISRAEAASQHASQAAIANIAYPSLERSSSRLRRRVALGSSSSGIMGGMASPTAVANSVSMEDLGALEASGVHGNSKMSYREVFHANSEAFSVGQPKIMNSNHRLPNTEAYPPHYSHAAKTVNREVAASIYHQGLAAAAAAARAVMDDGGGGPYPYPSPRSSTLLPGQTYPEPPTKHGGSIHSIASLQEALIQRDLRLTASSSNSAVAQQNGNSESPPPPLYPKQYHQVVEQRRRSGLDRPTAIAVPLLESPAVDRKIKPGLNKTISSSTLNGCDTLTPPPLTSATSASSTTSSSAEAPAPSFARSGPLSPPGSNTSTLKYVPYRETTKPFEMSDFYKYSTKYRKAHSESSTSSNDSPRNSTACANSQPPELPAKPSHHPASPAKASLPPPPPPLPPVSHKKLPQPPDSGESADSVGDAFSSEMLAWYNTQKGSGAPNSTSHTNNNSTKPATLV